MSGMFWVASALVVVGASATAYYLLKADGLPLPRFFRAYEALLERHTSFLFLRYGGADVARVQAVSVWVCLLAFVATRESAFAVACPWLALGPPLFLWKRRRSRVVKLERQLDSWLLMVANALKSSASVGEAIASTTPLVPRPFREEVDLLVKEIRLGVALDRALSAAARRIGSNVVSGALTMIAVARHTGGNLSETLERTAAALRETARLEGVLRTKTAEGRGQVLVLSAVPFLLCIVIAWLDRSWFDPMLSHPYGKVMLAVCAAAWTVATVWAHQIVGSDL